MSRSFFSRTGRSYPWKKIIRKIQTSCCSNHSDLAHLMVEHDHLRRHIVNKSFVVNRSEGILTSKWETIKHKTGIFFVPRFEKSRGFTVERTNYERFKVRCCDLSTKKQNEKPTAILRSSSGKCEVCQIAIRSTVKWSSPTNDEIYVKSGSYSGEKSNWSWSVKR